jgi:hypothetical protein
MWGLWEAGLVLGLSLVQIIRLKLMFEGVHPLHFAFFLDSHAG